jgi:hypothetical protein
LYNFLAYLECVGNYAWSKGHSDPDLSSVTSYTRKNLNVHPIYHSQFTLPTLL